MRETLGKPEKAVNHKTGHVRPPFSLIPKHHDHLTINAACRARTGCTDILCAIALQQHHEHLKKRFLDTKKGTCFSSSLYSATDTLSHLQCKGNPDTF